MVPQHRLFLPPTDRPAEPAVVNGHGNGNIGDGHRSFSSGASILRVLRLSAVVDPINPHLLWCHVLAPPSIA